MADPRQPDPMIENRTFDEIAIGDCASVSEPSVSRTSTSSRSFGRCEPGAYGPAYAATDMFHKVIAMA